MKEYEVNLIFMSNDAEEMNIYNDYFICMLENLSGSFSGIIEGNRIGGVMEFPEPVSIPDLNNKIVLEFGSIGISVIAGISEYSGE